MDLSFKATMTLMERGASVEVDPHSGPQNAAEYSEPGLDLVAVEIVAYSGGILTGSSLGTAVVDLDGLEIDVSTPLLIDHDTGFDGVCGQVMCSKTGGQIVAHGSIDKRTNVGQQVIRMAKAGHQWQASVGLEVTQEQHVMPGKLLINGQELTIPAGGATLVRKGRLREISIVSVGADPSTKVSIKAKAASMILEAQKTEVTEVADDAVVTERKRVAYIAGLTAKYGAPNKDAIIAQAIEEDWDCNKAELALLRASRSVIPTALPHQTSNPEEGQILEASLLVSTGLPESRVGKFYDERTMNAAVSREYRGAGLHHALMGVLRAAGRHIPRGNVDREFIKAAFEADRQLRASAFSTISLPGILSNTANKSMLVSYEAVETTWQKFCRIASNVNFKAHARYRMVASGEFEQVASDGALKHVTLVEEAYSSTIKTYGAMI